VTETCEKNIFYQRHLSEFAINITDDEISNIFTWS